MRRQVDFVFNALRNGAFFKRLQIDADSTPQLRMDDGGAIKTALSCEVKRDDDINWTTDELQAVMILDGVEHPLGVYIPTTAEESEAEDVPRVKVEAYDRAWRVQDQKAETKVYFGAGTRYLAAVEQLLTACGVGLIQATDNTETLAESREDWDIGTSYLTIINELLGEINYKPLWFNGSGMAMLEPAQAAGAGSIAHTLDSSTIKSLLLPTFRRETDIFSAPNVFICVCNNPDKSGQMIATAVNTNPLSALSVGNRGRRIVKLVKLNNIADQTALQAYADRLRDDSMGVHETVTVQTALLPGWGVDDVTALRYKDFYGIFTERSWSMELVPGGTMTHTLERVIMGSE